MIDFHIVERNSIGYPNVVRFFITSGDVSVEKINRNDYKICFLRDKCQVSAKLLKEMKAKISADHDMLAVLDVTWVHAGIIYLRCNAFEFDRSGDPRISDTLNYLVDTIGGTTAKDE